MCAILPPEYMQYGSLGVPVPSIEIKLVDVPDAGYFATNKPCAQGEVLIRGNSVTQGYFKRDDQTKEAITDDGWFRTGDIGQWNGDGSESHYSVRFRCWEKACLLLMTGAIFIQLSRSSTVRRTSSSLQEASTSLSSGLSRCTSRRRLLATSGQCSSPLAAHTHSFWAEAAQLHTLKRSRGPEREPADGDHFPARGQPEAAHGP